ncbi:MAG: hypothetical protein HGB15_00360 [Chlorobaculum sp.]|nr:hypothetical protein [Chlorobaculum sp.]
MSVIRICFRADKYTQALWTFSQALQSQYADEEFVCCQTPPTVVGTPDVVYPEAARFSGTEGKVFVRVLIGEDGNPMKSGIVKRIPDDCTEFDYDRSGVLKDK